ncbi:MAG: thermonuclease family protein [Anaerolineae bacterium]|nr:thermonuclease family protein [Anaerolineae bacterium]MDQ7037372.1 thermonuclease family protein [Anaerolineae bacterium]
MLKQVLLLTVMVLLLAACETELMQSVEESGGNIRGETAQVVRVIDGDTIDVNLNGETVRVRYVGVNTPERDEPCYSEATAANRRMVDGQTVTLVRDSSNTDRYDRLLRFIYVGDTFVNRELVAQGYAEAVLYEPDNGFHDTFVQLERTATRDGLGCHPTGIFDDNSTTR